MLNSPLAVLLTLSLVPYAALVKGQEIQGSFDARVEAIRKLVESADADRRTKILGQIEPTGQFGSKLLVDWVLGGRLRQDPGRRYIEEARTDKQLGATSNSAGSTNLVSKAGAPSFLSFAVENGALAQSVSGTTTTFRGNLVGVFDLLPSIGYQASFDDDRPVTRFLRRVSYSFSLDTARQSPAAGTSTEQLPGESNQGRIDRIRQQIGDFQQQLSSYSMRMELWNRRDPRSLANRPTLTRFMDKQGVGLLMAHATAVAKLPGSPEYTAWRNDTLDELENADPQLVKTILARRLDQLAGIARSLDPDFDEKVERLHVAAGSFASGRVKVLDELNSKPLVTFEYVAEKQVMLPDLSTVRLIGEGQFSSRLDLTGNFSLRYFNTKPITGTRSFRDFQLAAQGDYRLGRGSSCCSSEGFGSAILTFATLFQHLPDDASVQFGGATIPVKQGNIAVGQIKLTVPVKGSGVKIPISFTVANRSELIHEKKNIGVNVGITWDFDSVAAAFRR